MTKFRLYKVIPIVLILSLHAFDNSFAQKSNLINNEKALWTKDSKIQIKLHKVLGGLHESDDNYIFYNPSDVKIDSDGNIYVLDSSNDRIQKYNKDEEFVSTIGGPGSGPGEFSKPSLIEIDKNGNIYICDVPRYIMILDKMGKEIRRFRPNLLVEDMSILSTEIYYYTE